MENMASLLFGSNISHYIRVDYHGPLHRRNGLQIPSFPKRFAGELTIICFLLLFFLSLWQENILLFTATELVRVREDKKNKILASTNSDYLLVRLFRDLLIRRTIVVLVLDSSFIQK